MTEISRRDLLKLAGLSGAGLFLPAIAENVSAISYPDAAPDSPRDRKTMKGVPFERHDVVRIGIVGTGLRGRSVLHELLAIENCNYGGTEMLVNRLMHDGVFGDVLHAEAAYLHDLREILFENRDEGLWRRAWHTRANANLYPTHGLGPVSWYLDVNAGDRYDYLVSISGPERGLAEY